MQEAIEVLEKAESVLMKRIRAMREGKPKWAASDRLLEIREALKLIKSVKLEEISEDAFLIETFTQNPPRAEA
jgi:hypothetical protein